ncbi:unnamed protein product, partial [Heligmosomoides polygyrus]|uniref:DUF5641 domain-containing protein n=1 Tax=Heligmosomoides polygyrus TaxID=6339 RepID=A0A183FWD2_HELPZ
EIDASAKYPIFIWQKSLLAEIIIRDLHGKGHAGKGILDSPVAITSLVFNSKMLAVPEIQQPPVQILRQEDQPRERVVRLHPFQDFGLDYFGPLTTRPLTHMSSDFSDNQTLRPIDFIQRRLQVTYPLGITPPGSGDPEYLPSDIGAVFQTRNQAIVALESSCKHTEKFWRIWQTQYLTALREKHVVEVAPKKGCQRAPRTGAVVLLCNPNQPRHFWKMGVINKLIVSNNGTIREAVVRLSSQRLIRRPVNLPVPLELEQEDNNRSKNQEETCPSMRENLEEALLPSRTSEEATKPQEQATSHEHQRYHLRKRRRINYNESPEEVDDIEDYTTSVSNTLNVSALLQISLVLSVIVGVSKETAENTSMHSIQCTPGGITLFSQL